MGDNVAPGVGVWVGVEEATGNISGNGVELLAGVRLGEIVVSGLSVGVTSDPVAFVAVWLGNGTRSDEAPSDSGWLRISVALKMLSWVTDKANARSV